MNIFELPGKIEGRRSVVMQLPDEHFGMNVQVFMEVSPV
jgi:hypothetical protein